MVKRLLAVVFVFAVYNVYADDTLSVSSPSHLIQVRGRDTGSVTAQVTVAEVIGKDQYDVQGPRRRLCFSG